METRFIGTSVLLCVLAAEKGHRGSLISRQHERLCKVSAVVVRCLQDGSGMFTSPSTPGNSSIFYM